MLGGADNPNGELPSYITGANMITGGLIKQRNKCFLMVDKGGHVNLRKKQGTHGPGEEQVFPFGLK